MLKTWRLSPIRPPSGRRGPMMAATFEGAGVARRAAHHERQRAAREALDALGDAPPAEVNSELPTAPNEHITPAIGWPPKKS